MSVQFTPVICFNFFVRTANDEKLPISIFFGSCKHHEKFPISCGDHRICKRFGDAEIPTFFGVNFFRVRHVKNGVILPGLCDDDHLQLRLDTDGQPEMDVTDELYRNFSGFLRVVGV